MREMIPIFYACDDNFVKYTIVSLKSMIDNASTEYDYYVHILHTNITPEKKEALYHLQNDNFHVEFNNVNEYLESISDRLPIRDYYSKTTYFRLFISEMFHYEKAIYIDSDTIVLGDISELYQFDIEDNYLGAVQDQAMGQEDIFGEYAEKVVGVDRNNFFNAGILLMNCRKFREEQVLRQFMDLLHVYNFVVTQDEDYLNLICKDQVKMLPLQWNAQVFKEMPYPVESIKIIHYIMVSKPWHYRDCRLNEYFWRYAKDTVVYDEIIEELNNYTDKQREADMASGERLKETAIAEINREDNYLNMLNTGKLKALDRISVLNKIAELEREGRFDEDVEEDPPSRELEPNQIDYLRKKMLSKLKAKLTYKVARYYMNNLIDNRQLIIKDIIGLDHYKNLTSGAIITCNHFNALDSFAMQIAYEASGQSARKLFRVIREGNYTNFPGFYGALMRNCNTFPLSSNIKTMKKFMKSMDEVLQEGNFMLVYPEQSMWWNYRKPKPLKNGAFHFAVNNNVPVLPCFITMSDSDVLDDNGFYVQEYTIHISKPIYPEPFLSKADNVRQMRDKNFEIWKDIYEEVYGEKLTYLCDAEDDEQELATE